MSMKVQSNDAFISESQILKMVQQVASNSESFVSAGTTNKANSNIAITSKKINIYKKINIQEEINITFKQLAAQQQKKDQMGNINNQYSAVTVIYLLERQEVAQN